MASWVKMKRVGSSIRADSRIAGRAVVAEDEEGRTERPQLRQRQPVHDRAPWRARGCRNGSCGHPDCRARSRLRRRTSARVLFEGARSAEPPRNQGMFWASTFSAAPEASRPATPFGSAGKLGRLLSQPFGSSRRCIWSISAASSGYFLRVIGEKRLPSAAVPLRPARRCRARNVAMTPSGTRNLRIFRPAIGALGQADLLLAQRLAMGVRGVTACAGSHSRCGCPG